MSRTKETPVHVVNIILSGVRVYLNPGHDILCLIIIIIRYFLYLPSLNGTFITYGISSG